MSDEPGVPPSVEAAEAEREQVLAWISETSGRLPQAQQRVAFLNGWIVATRQAAQMRDEVARLAE